MTHVGNRGSTIIEALVATTLVAFAGAVIASAAATNLGAVRRAGAIERLTTVAARELAAVQATAAAAASDEAALAEPGFASPLRRQTLVTRRADGIVELTVTVATEPAVERVSLATRVLVAP